MKNKIFIFSTREIDKGGLFNKSSVKGSFCFNDGINRDYYEISKDSDDSVGIVAVHALNENDKKNKDVHNREWITCLIDILKTDANEKTEYFLILHDRDLYGFEDFDFKVLMKTEKEKFVDNVEKVNIITFKHTSNDAIKILIQPFDKKTFNEKKIEDIFYKKIFLDLLCRCIDDVINGIDFNKDNCDNWFTRIFFNNYNCNNMKNSKSAVSTFRELYEKKIDFNDDDVKFIYDIYLEIEKIPNLKQLLKNYFGDVQKYDIKILEISDYRFTNKFTMNHNSKIIKNEAQGLLFYQDTKSYEKLFKYDKDKGKKRNELTPTIYISLFNFLDIKNKDLGILTPYLPRYRNIIDSNIWNYYVPYYKNFESFTEGNKDKLDEDFKERLRDVVYQINENHNNRLYTLSKTREYINLMYRLLKESYLEDVGHAALVSPFVFTSESKMKKSADDVLNEIKKIDIKNLSWRFLLIDDEAFLSDGEVRESDLTECEKEEIKNYGYTYKCKKHFEIAQKRSKCQIIKNIFCNDFNFECECGKDNLDCKLTHKDLVQKQSNKPSVKMVCVKNNTAALEKLKSTEKYDIVLMDYLLGYNEKNEREYSTEILEEIEKGFKNENKIMKGIYGKFWFFYTSAYNVAVHERLLEKQFLHVTEYWHIEEGACPMNTPQLFRYLLFSYMKRQIDVITRLQEKINDENKLITAIDTLNYIFKDVSNVRSIATKNFNNLLKLRLTYDKIKYDTCWKINEKKEQEERNKKIEKSELITSLFPDIQYYDNAFWEHTMHLVYLTAYGTIRQWHDMWDEFMLIKPYLQNVYNENKNTNCGSTAENVVIAIEKYITGLQKQSG